MFVFLNVEYQLVVLVHLWRIVGIVAKVHMYIHTLVVIVVIR